LELLTVVDNALRSEGARFALRYTCEHCAHFDEATRGCAEGYPNAPHVEDRLEASRAIEFCKSFELA
jgi:hypothetical protein